MKVVAPWIVTFVRCCSNRRRKFGTVVLLRGDARNSGHLPSLLIAPRQRPQACGSVRPRAFAVLRSCTGGAPGVSSLANAIDLTGRLPVLVDIVRFIGEKPNNGDEETIWITGKDDDRLRLREDRGEIEQREIGWR